MEKKILNEAAYASYPDLFNDMRTLAAEYGNMPIDNVFSAWTRASMATNPYIQNKRVKSISSLPRDYGKDDIAQMLAMPDGHELPLRQTAHSLESSAYPYLKIRLTYQGINTYKYYSYASYLTEDDAESSAYEREAVLVDKLSYALKPDQWAHQIVGQVLQEGKIAYIPRVSVDKSHNKIDYAFLQQIPSDWWKIVGFNNVSKYTVMFNMMYFLQPGADWRQFGDLFKPYLDDFDSILEPMYTAPVPRKGKEKIVYAGRNVVKNASGELFRLKLDVFAEKWAGAENAPQLFNQNGKWAYWVTLPVDRCWVFEVDDASRNVVTPFTGLFLAMDQIAAYESVQLEIVQNPLVSVALGEIPYMQSEVPDKADNYQLSGAGRQLFTAYWYNMLAEANTSGIGVYFAPVENLHLESLAEAPNATDISTKGYSYAVEKSGLSALIPINDNPRAGAATLSAMLEERFCICVYNQMSNMMEHIYRTLNLKYDWRFKMFGGFSTDSKLLEQAQSGMQRGVLSDTYVYLALKDRSVIGDLSMSRAIKASGILDLRLPMVTSYSANQTESGLPPQAGRPQKNIEDIPDEGVGDGQEDDLDNGGDE